MKKGFTLVELIAVIVLLGLVMTITGIAVMNVKKNSNQTLCSQKVKYIESGAIKWGEDNLNNLSSVCNNVLVGSLISDGYITGDDDTNNNLLVPGSNTYFSGPICVKYENITPDDINSYMEEYSYHDYRNYQITAKYQGTECN